MAQSPGSLDRIFPWELLEQEITLTEGRRTTKALGKPVLFRQVLVLDRSFWSTISMKKGALLDMGYWIAGVIGLLLVSLVLYCCCRVSGIAEKRVNDFLQAGTCSQDREGSKSSP